MNHQVKFEQSLKLKKVFGRDLLKFVVKLNYLKFKTDSNFFSAPDHNLSKCCVPKQLSLKYWLSEEYCYETVTYDSYDKQ